MQQSIEYSTKTKYKCLFFVLYFIDYRSNRLCNLSHYVLSKFCTASQHHRNWGCTSQLKPYMICWLCSPNGLYLARHLFPCTPNIFAEHIARDALWDCHFFRNVHPFTPNMLGRGVMLNVVEKERRALVDSPSSSSWQTWQTWQLSATLSSQVQLRCPVAAGKQKQMHTRVMYTKHVTKRFSDCWIKSSSP